MSKATWAAVTPGAVVELKGKPWKVEKAKLKGKKVKVTVSGPAGEFTSTMDAKSKVTLVEGGWAAKSGLKGKLPERSTPPKMPKVEKSTAEWNESEDAGESTVKSILDAKLLAVEVDGVYLMPHVGPDTVAAHLYAFHGVTAEGADLQEAKRLAKTHSPEKAVSVLSWAKLSALHDHEHELIEAGTKPALVPHLHTEDRPKGKKS